MTPARFATVELIERIDAEGEDVGHVLTEVRIDGVKYHMPLESKVTTESSFDGLTSVTLTLMVDSLSIYRLPRQVTA